MVNRYSFSVQIQPIRQIPVSITDIYHDFTMQDTIDKLAFKFYGDVKLGWIIMCANPQYYHELEVKNGDKIRIPMPLNRVWPYVGIDGSDY